MDIAGGVYFRHDDYAPFWLRLLVGLIDAGTFLGLCVVAIFVLSPFVPAKLILLVCAAVLFCYFVLLKRSAGGTVGYRVCGVRIVGLDGQLPGLIPLTIRMLFMVFGPINFLLDLVWMANEDQRQTLRDKFAATYIVKKHAVPAGTGKLTHRYYHILGYNFLFREVEINRTS